MRLFVAVWPPEGVVAALAARDRWRDTPTSVGPVPVLLPLVTIEGHEVPFGRVPELGEHTAAVLRELGLSDEEIEAAAGR